MSNEAVAQAWYRMLRTIGDPIDLCRPAVISQTPAFLRYAIASPVVVDPCQHPCLQQLPYIFLKAIKGIAGQVDAFLGMYAVVFPFRDRFNWHNNHTHTVHHILYYLV